MVAPTWHDRELRFLEHVVQAWEDGGHDRVEDIAEALAIDVHQVVRLVEALRDDGYVAGVGVAEWPHLLRIEPTAQARRAVRQWPTPGDELYDRLMAVLDERIANEPDERQRNRLQRARSSLADVGRNVLAGALVEAMKYSAGLGG